MAGHAAFHRNWNFQRDRIVRDHIPVALLAINSHLAMAGVAEEHEILDGVHLHRRKRSGIVPERCQPLDIGTIFPDSAVAIHALSDGRK